MASSSSSSKYEGMEASVLLGKLPITKTPSPSSPGQHPKPYKPACLQHQICQFFVHTIQRERGLRTIWNARIDEILGGGGGGGGFVAAAASDDCLRLDCGWRAGRRTWTTTRIGDLAFGWLSFELLDVLHEIFDAVAGSSELGDDAVAVVEEDVDFQLHVLEFGGRKVS